MCQIFEHYPTHSLILALQHIREQGEEFGATTNRARRCGWLDLVAVRKGLRINGSNGVYLGLTRLDILDRIGRIKVANAYLDLRTGEITETFPETEAELAYFKPVFQDFQGWLSSTRGIRTFRELPRNAQSFIRSIEELTGINIAAARTGPEQGERIGLIDLWKV